MHVIIEENPAMPEGDVIIACRTRTDAIDAAAEALRSGGTTIGSIGEKKYVVRTTDILYFESVDKVGFFYTSDQVYRTELRLYEVEAQLKTQYFLRISKSMVLNLLKIEEISPFVAGKLRLRLCNGEYIIVSRSYVRELRRELGI